MDFWTDIFEKVINTIGTLCTMKVFISSRDNGQIVNNDNSNISSSVNPVSRTHDESKLRDSSSPPSPKKRTSVGKFLRNNRPFIWIIFIAILTILSLQLVKHFSNRSPEKSPIPTITPNFIISIPTKTSIQDIWLDELEPILHKPRAFYYHEWSRYDLIQIEDTIYPHSIGICIPSDELKEYCNDGFSDEILHDEYLEYRLAYKYKSFQFDYGIDDISFPDDVETASRCEFKIVVQSCNSKEYLGSKDNILFDSDWINYRSIIYRSSMIDVSSCENIRITVYWKFYFRTCGPIAFNIAIINPILRGKKVDTYVSEPSSTHSKPDSIR